MKKPRRLFSPCLAIRGTQPKILTPSCVTLEVTWRTQVGIQLTNLSPALLPGFEMRFGMIQPTNPVCYPLPKVEALLSHGGPPSELIRKLPTLPSGGSANSAAGRHTIDTDAELARQLAAEDERRSNSSSRRPEGGYRGMEHGTQQSGFGLATGRSNYQNTRRPPQRDAGVAPQNSPPRRPAPSPPAGTKGVGTPTTLPKDFLRIPGRTPDTALDSASSGQQMTDEQMARSKLPATVFSKEFSRLTTGIVFCSVAGRIVPRGASE